MLHVRYWPIVADQETSVVDFQYLQEGLVYP